MPAGTPTLAQVLTWPDNNCYMGGFSVGVGLQTASSLRMQRGGSAGPHVPLLPQWQSQGVPLPVEGWGWMRSLLQT